MATLRGDCIIVVNGKININLHSEYSSGRYRKLNTDNKDRARDTKATKDTSKPYTHLERKCTTQNGR